MTTSAITTSTALSATELAEIADRIRIRMRHTIADIIETGRDLTAAKAQLGHGQFSDWVWDEFSMSARTAQNYMRAAEWAEGKNEIISHLSPTAVYALAAPSTPTAVTDRVIADSKAGKPVTDEYVKRHIKAAKEQERKKKARAARAADRATTAGYFEDVSTEQAAKTRSDPVGKAIAERAERNAWQEQALAEIASILQKLDRGDLGRLVDLFRDDRWGWRDAWDDLAPVLVGPAECAVDPEVDQVVDDDPLVIPAVFRREKTT
jgi:hypothetical protein